MLLGFDASRAVTGQRTGTEAYAYWLIRALIPLAEMRGYRLRLYFNQPPPDGLFPASAMVENVVIPQRRLWTHTRLAAELRRRPPDLFFTPAHVIPLPYHGRSAATVHDLGYHHFPQAHPGIQLRYLKWSTRHNGRRAALLFADSLATRADLMRYDGVPGAKIQVVYPGVDPDLGRVEEAAALAAVQRKVGVSRPYFLSVGTIQPRKNLGRLIQAYAQSRLPQALVLAGKTGWLSQPILDEIASLPAAISEKILLPGFIADADKAALLSGATAVLFPSLYEGFGFPILEAQACGVPVLTANSSSCPEVAGEGALLVDPLDVAAISAGMQNLAADERLRRDLVARGTRNVRRFNWQETAVRILNGLETAVN